MTIVIRTGVDSFFGRLPRGSDLEAGEQRCADRTCAARGVDLEEATVIRTRTDGIGDADGGLGRTEQQRAIALQALRETLEDRSLGLLIEIDQHVAAEDDVERP